MDEPVHEAPIPHEHLNGNGTQHGLVSHPEKVLLINPPIYDTRLPWGRWLQPTLLLRLATRLKKSDVDVKLIDAVHRRPQERLRRQLAARLQVDGVNVYKWRLGPSRFSLLSQMKQLRRSGWAPDQVYVECLTTFWWEGVRETTELIKECFPDCRVVLLGPYASLAPNHAVEKSGVDEVCDPEFVADLGTFEADVTLYPHPPTFLYLSLGNGQRTAEEIVQEISARVGKRATYHFAFVEHGIAGRFQDLYRSVLERLIALRVQPNFYALGNIAASDLLEQPDLAELMRRAGFVQIHFADDRDVRPTEANGERFVEEHRLAADICHKAGFPERTDALSAGLSVGRPDERLESRAELATLLAHYVGSVIPWPYQPSPAECPGLPLEEQNSRLFPLRDRNETTFRDYMDLLALTALLNSKYRDHTFDFLGDSLIPKLFQGSLERRGWDPPAEVKGTLQLPMVQR